MLFSFFIVCLFILFPTMFAYFLLNTIIKRLRSCGSIFGSSKFNNDENSCFSRIRPNSTVLITGGSAGIGLSIAEEFAKRHCNLIIVGRREALLEDMAWRCIELGAVSATAVVCDISDSKQVKENLPELSRLDYLVLNAGQGGISSFDDSEKSYEICEKLIEVNYLANVRVIQKYLKALRNNEKNIFKDNQNIENTKGVDSHVNRKDDDNYPSAILVISSLAGILPSALRAAYSASKHAIQGFCDSLRMELNGDKNKRSCYITLVCPGFVDTGFHDKVLTVSDSKNDDDNSDVDNNKKSNCSLTSADKNKEEKKTEKKYSNNRKSMSPQEVAALSIDALEHRKYELILTNKGKIGYYLRPLLPEIVDYFAKYVAIKSVSCGKMKIKPD